MVGLPSATSSHCSMIKRLFNKLVLSKLAPGGDAWLKQRVQKKESKMKSFFGFNSKALCLGCGKTTECLCEVAESLTDIGQLACQISLDLYALFLDKNLPQDLPSKLKLKRADLVLIKKSFSTIAKTVECWRLLPDPSTKLSNSLEPKDMDCHRCEQRYVALYIAGIKQTWYCARCRHDLSRTAQTDWSPDL